MGFLLWRDCMNYVFVGFLRSSMVTYSIHKCPKDSGHLHILECKECKKSFTVKCVTPDKVAYMLGLCIDCFKKE